MGFNYFSLPLILSAGTTLLNWNGCYRWSRPHINSVDTYRPYKFILYKDQQSDIFFQHSNFSLSRREKSRPFPKVNIITADPQWCKEPMHQQSLYLLNSLGIFQSQHHKLSELSTYVKSKQYGQPFKCWPDTCAGPLDHYCMCKRINITTVTSEWAR